MTCRHFPRAASVATLVLCMACSPALLAQAQPAPDASATEAPAPATPAGAKWLWSSSAGYNHYREPSLDMTLQGPEVGLHLRLSDLPGWPRLQLESDVLLGAQRYDSDQGQLSPVANLETRWRALYQAWPQGSYGRDGLFAGPAFHTLYNDLRGTTTGGARGYERTNYALWLALQWRQSIGDARWGPVSGLQVDAGHLIRARHYSYLSQARVDYPDLSNTQKRGWYAQLALDIKTAGTVLQPFIRFTRLEDSDRTVAGDISGIEPASRRWHAGLKASWPAR